MYEVYNWVKNMCCWDFSKKKVIEYETLCKLFISIFLSRILTKVYTVPWQTYCPEMRYGLLDTVAINI